jgi:hypothetical protein
MVLFLFSVQERVRRVINAITVSAPVMTHAILYVSPVILRVRVVTVVRNVMGFVRTVCHVSCVIISVREETPVLYATKVVKVVMIVSPVIRVVMLRAMKDVMIVSLM